MHATVLLLLDFVHLGGHNNSPKEVFGDYTTEVSNNAMIIIDPVVFCNYRMQLIMVFWCIGYLF
jgi:hypothetical protein